MSAPGQTAQPQTQQSQVVSDLPVFDEHALTPQESVQYEDRAPTDILTEEVGKGKLGPLPRGLFNGDQIAREGGNTMFGGYGPDASADEVSTRIQMKLDLDKQLRGNSQVRGTKDDAITALRAQYQTRIAPLEARRTQILTEMFGPENARTLVSLKELDPGQAAIGLGAMVGAIMRGEDPGDALEFVVAPIRAKFAEKQQAKALRDKMLGMEYDELGNQIGFEQKIFGEQSDFARQTEIADINAQKARDVAKEQSDREEMKQDKLFTRQAAAELGKIDDSKDPALALQLWENAYGKYADESTWKLANKLSERYGRAAEAKIAMDSAKKAQLDENTKRLREGFNSWLTQEQNKAISSKWDAKRKEVEFKAAAKGLEFLPRQLALGVQGMRLRNRQIETAIKMAESGDLRGWYTALTGVDLRQQAIDQTSLNQSWEEYQGGYENYLKQIKAIEDLTGAIAEDKAAGLDTSRLEQALESLGTPEAPKPRAPFLMRGSGPAAAGAMAGMGGNRPVNPLRGKIPLGPLPKNVQQLLGGGR